MQTHFPSGGGPDSGAGLLLTPFRAVRYDLSRVGELANVTSPPYDVIGPGTLERLRDASPYNVVKLILPTDALGSEGESEERALPRAEARGGLWTQERRPRNEGGATREEAAFGRAEASGASRVSAASTAAARLRDWRAEGVLAVDDAPAFYVYEQRARGWVQRGLIGLVTVGTDAVHPHEGVMPGPVAGRQELMRETRSNLEPILLVYNGGAVAGGHRGPAGLEGGLPGEHPSVPPGAASRLTDLTADRQAPLASVATDDGVTHRLWAVTDPATQAAIAADLATRTALIADGHHRYAAYRGLQAEMHASGLGDGPWDYGLAFLVDADAYPLRLGPIHRVLPRLDPAEAARLAAGAFTVTEVPRGAAMDRLAAAGESGTAFLIAGHGRYWLLTDPDPRQVAAAMPPQSSPRWQALDASVMQELLLAQLWSIEDNERDVLISHDADEAVRMATDSGGTAVISNPMPLVAVMDIAAHGEKVPRKSTSFGPKPRTGLVLRTFE